MKKLFYSLIMVIATLFTFASCESDDEKLTISFEAESYTLAADGSVTIKLIASKAFPQATAIDFAFGGNAVLNTDYTASATQFAFTAGSKEASIVLTAKENFDQNLSIKLTLGTLPVGYEAGKYTSVMVAVEAKDEITYSFESRKYALTSAVDVQINLIDANGSKYVATQDLTLEVKPTSNSTAVEGVNYSFKNGKTITVSKGASVAVVTLNLLAKEDKKDLIELALIDKRGFVAGNFATTKVSIMGAIVDKLYGDWKFKEFVNLQWLKDNMMADLTNAPKASSADVITFTKEGMLINNIKGGLKAYFNGDSEFTDKGERIERLQEQGGLNPEKLTIAVLEMSNINVHFDSSNQLVRNALVGFAVKTIDNVETLIVTIYDYEPTSFMNDVYQFFKGYAAPGETEMQSAPVRIYFTR